VGVSALSNSLRRRVNSSILISAILPPAAHLATCAPFADPIESFLAGPVAFTGTIETARDLDFHFQFFKENDL
jgi:hypothetical protein